MIDIYLNKKEAVVLHEVSRALIGRTVAVCVDEDVLLTPIVRSAIADGHIQVASFPQNEIFGTILDVGPLPLSVEISHEGIIEKNKTE